MSNEVSTVASNLNEVDQLLRDLRTTPALLSTPELAALTLRVESALLALGENNALGSSQLMNPVAMKAYMDFGTFVSKGHATLPDHLKGNPADCTAIAIRADRWGLDFYGVAEKTFVIKGRLGYEAQLVGAILKNMGVIKEAFEVEYFGDWSKINGKSKELESKRTDDHGKPLKYRVPDWKPEDEKGLGIRIWATPTGATKPRELEMLMTQALTRNSTLWASNPQQQLFYLAEKFWARRYAPEALLGVYTRDELESTAVPKDMGQAEEVRPESLGQDVLAAWEAASKRGKTAASDYWLKLDPKLRKRSTQAQRDHYWGIAVEADRKRTVDNGAQTSTDGATPAGQAASTTDTAAAAAATADGALPAADPELDEFTRALGGDDDAPGGKA